MMAFLAAVKLRHSRVEKTDSSRVALVYGFVVD